MTAAVLVLGGALELIGLGLVAWDVWDVHQGRLKITPESMKNEPFNKYTVAEDTYKLVSGNMRRRALGVGVFAVGVRVQTTANLAAL
jgi:hypothetical protein